MKTNKQEIQEELNANGAILRNVSKKMPFEVPESFFLENENELASIILIKNKSSDEMPFSVPAAYFNNLTFDINTKTEYIKKRTFTWRWNMSSMAASLIFVLLCYSFFTNKTESSSTIALSDLPTEDIQQYLIQNDVSIAHLEQTKSTVKLEDINNETIDEFLNEIL